MVHSQFSNSVDPKPNASPNKSQNFKADQGYLIFLIFLQCRVLAWRDLTREIITASQDGIITIWSAKEGSPIYVLQAHPGSPITQMHWIEDRQELITCGKDKKVKVWSLPKVWYDEEEVKRQIMEEQSKEQKAKEQLTREVESSKDKPKEQLITAVYQQVRQNVDGTHEEVLDD